MENKNKIIQNPRKVYFIILSILIILLLICMSFYERIIFINKKIEKNFQNQISKLNNELLKSSNIQDDLQKQIEECQNEIILQKASDDSIIMESQTDNIYDDWNIFQNKMFHMKYPANFVKDENLIGGDVLYSIAFGLPYVEVFEQEHPNLNSAKNFLISVYKKETDIESFIQERKEKISSVEKSLEKIEKKEIDGITAIVVETCDMGGYCKELYYFSYNDLMYVIVDNFYDGFKGNEEEGKEIFNNMLDTFELIKKAD